ncbi:hypothetical protein BD770DRAFT_441040 [Pilaira anomala]|nr:hypothetical protein BD770DRAFT_441040 [Pilaira anomala]
MHSKARMDQTLFPQQENDPFHTQITNTEEPTSPLCSSSTTTTVPRWQLLTDKEQKERDSVLAKLESKLQKLNKKKEKSIPNYTNQIIPDVSRHFESDHDDEEEEEEEENRPEEEDAEGLPLLWKNKSTGLDETPRKTEDQYNKRILPMIDAVK